MLIDTLKSPYAKVTALPQQDITLAAGLWKRMADNWQLYLLILIPMAVK